MSLTITNPGIIKTQRENDCHLMDVIIQSNIFRPCELKRFNYCRLYLDVTLLSDIVSASGTQITFDSYNGIKTQEHTQVHQHNPSPSTWQLWRRGLHCFAYRDTQKLLKPLGAWLVHHSAPRHNFSLFSPSTNQVYQQDNNQWYSYNRDPFLPSSDWRISSSVAPFVTTP